MSDNPLQKTIQKDGINTIEDLIDDVAKLKAREQASLVSARVYNSIDLVIPDNISTFLTFDSERWDTSSIHVAGSSRLVAPINGLYVITTNIMYATNVVGHRILRIFFNGTNFIANISLDGQTTVQTRMELTTQYQLLAGQYVEANTLQTSGGNLNIQSVGNYSPEFMMTRIG